MSLDPVLPSDSTRRLRVSRPGPERGDFEGRLEGEVMIED